MTDVVLRLRPTDLQVLGLDAETGASIRVTGDQLRLVVGARLDAALKRRGISQADLARKLGKARSVVSRWCDGTNMVSTPRLLEITAALDLTHDELLPDVERSHERPAAPSAAT